MTWDLRIDGDNVVYTAGFAADSRGGDISHSLYNTKLIINKYMNMFPGTCKVPLTSQKASDNFRTQIVDNYKANRKDAKKPIYYQEIRDYLIAKFDATVCKWGEADDWLGVNPKQRTVIVSKDKDILMVPNVYHCRMTNDKIIKSSDPGKLFLSKCRKKILGCGFQWFAAQMIMGDKIDNILKPSKGFGPVAVFEMFKDCKSKLEMWIKVQNHWIDSGKSEDEMMTNAQLLWISRKPKQMFNLELLGE